MTETTPTHELLCGSLWRPCQVLAESTPESPQVRMPGHHLKVMLLDVDCPGLSVTWQRAELVREVG